MNPTLMLGHARQVGAEPKTLGKRAWRASLSVQKCFRRDVMSVLVVGNVKRMIFKEVTWVLDAQKQRNSTVVTVVEAVAGDGHRAVDHHLMLLTVLCYM